VPRLCEFYPGICLTTEEKARNNLSQGKKNLSQVKKNLSQFKKNLSQVKENLRIKTTDIRRLKGLKDFQYV
jgi:multidrug resistance efflux pump